MICVVSFKFFFSENGKKEQILLVKVQAKCGANALCKMLFIRKIQKEVMINENKSRTKICLKLKNRIFWETIEIRNKHQLLPSITHVKSISYINQQSGNIFDTELSTIRTRK